MFRVQLNGAARGAASRFRGEAAEPALARLLGSPWGGEHDDGGGFAARRGDDGGRHFAALQLNGKRAFDAADFGTLAARGKGRGGAPGSGAAGAADTVDEIFGNLWKIV